jgi:hypothetical protein
MTSRDKRRAAGRAMRAAALVLFFLALLLSCGNMLSGADVTGGIQSAVEEENAEKVRIGIYQKPNAGGGSLSLNGPQTKKVGIPFSLTATTNDDYIFTGWTVSGSGEVRLSSNSNETIEVVIVSPADDIVIYGNFSERPRVAATSPYNHQLDVGLGDPVSITFSMAMAPGTLIYASNNIVISGKPAGLNVDWDNTFSSKFLAPSYDNDTNTLTITPKSGALLNSYKIQISLFAGIKSSNSVPLYCDTKSQFDYSTIAIAGP